MDVLEGFRAARAKIEAKYGLAREERSEMPAKEVSQFVGVPVFVGSHRRCRGEVGQEPLTLCATASGDIELGRCVGPGAGARGRPGPGGGRP